MEPMDFHEYAAAHDLEVDVYPFARFGLAMRRWARTFLFVTAGFALADYGIALLHGRALDDLAAGAGVPQSFVNGLGDFSHYLHLAALAVAFALAAFVALYLFSILARWHNYERNVVTNDSRAIKYRKKVLKSKLIKREISALDKKRAASKEKSESLEDESKRNALNCILNMRMYVNTRQSLDDEQLEWRHRVVIDVPSAQMDMDNLQNYLKDFEGTLTHVFEGEVNFNSQVMSVDQKKIEYTATQVIRDKYFFDESDEAAAAVKEIFDSTFAVSLFTDRQAEIDEQKKHADKWARESASIMDSLLTTMNRPCERIDFSCGASTAQFNYRMTFKIDDNHSVTSMPENIDKRFGITGSDVQAQGDRLIITVPVPDRYKQAINIPTLYREAFGDTEAIEIDPAA